MRRMFLVLLVLLLPATARSQQTQEPVDLDLTERVETELGSVRIRMQLKRAGQLSRQDRNLEEAALLAAANQAVSDLSIEDLRLKIGGKDVAVSSVDPICDLELVESWNQPAALTEAEGATDAQQIAQLFRQRPILYTFYIDRNYVTMAGFQAAMDQAESIVDELVRDEDYVALVISSRRQRAYVPVTRDKRLFRKTLIDIRKDTTNPEFAILPPDQVIYQRLDTIRQSANPETMAQAMARIDDRETLEAVERIGFTVKAMENPGVDADFRDKILFYFADLNKGSDAGMVYLNSQGAPSRGTTLSADAVDLLTRHANAAEVRFYTVQPHGQAPLSTPIQATRRNDFFDVADVATDAGRRALFTLAAETGGQAFVAGGANAQQILTKVRQDLACTVYVNFDVPRKMPRDRVLAVAFDWRNRDLSRFFILRPQGQYAINSEDTREANKLLGQFVGFTDDSQTSADGVGVYSVVRPRKFDGTRVVVEVQHVVDVDRAVPHFLRSEYGLAFQGQPEDIAWEFEHVLRLPGDRLRRQPPVTIRKLTDDRLVILRQHSVKFGERQDDQTVSVVAMSGVKDTDYRHVRRDDRLGLPAIVKQGKRYKAEEVSERSTPHITFLQELTGEAAYLGAVERRKMQRLQYAKVGTPTVTRQIDGPNGTPTRVDVALVDPSRALIVEFPLCRMRNDEDVRYRVLINGEAMTREDDAVEGDTMTGQVELGNQACTVHAESAFSASQLTSLFGRQEIHRYAVEVFQGRRQLYEMVGYFKVAPAVEPVETAGRASESAPATRPAVPDVDPGGS